jgi:hypothetical protein
MGIRRGLALERQYLPELALPFAVGLLRLGHVPGPALQVLHASLLPDPFTLNRIMPQSFTDALAIR